MRIKRKEASTGEVDAELVQKNTHLQRYSADQNTVLTDNPPHPPPHVCVWEFV